MRDDKAETSASYIDIMACLDAVSMYDAAYHQERDAYDPFARRQPPPVVSAWAYMRSVVLKTGAGLLGRLLMLAALLSGVLICANSARNLYDMDRAQTIVHEEKRYDPQKQEFYLYVWYEPSPYPLPKGYETANLHIYEALTTGLFLFAAAGRFSVKRARKISVGIPLHRADTAHLPAVTSLVRASQEPGRETLVRAAVRPSHLPNTLLRPAVNRPEEHTEQLVRSVGGQEQI